MLPGTDTDEGSKSFSKDVKNDITLFFNNPPEQYEDARAAYEKVNSRYPSEYGYEITVVGYSLGGSLAQLIGATYGVRTLTFNAYGVRDVLPKLKLDENKIRGNYKKITNYKTSSDVVYKYAEGFDHTKNLGDTYVACDNLNAIDSHLNLSAIATNEKIKLEDDKSYIGKRIRLILDVFKTVSSPSKKISLCISLINGLLTKSATKTHYESKHAADSIKLQHQKSSNGFGEKPKEHPAGGKAPIKQEKDPFIEGFDSNAFTERGAKQVKFQEKVFANKFNIGDPDTDEGHWITLPNKKHIFIKDE